MANGTAEHNRGVLVSPTQGDFNAFEKRARYVAEQVAVASSSVDANNSDQVVVRQLLPAEDLVSGADNDWDGEDERFVQTGLSAGENTVYEIDSKEKAEGKVVVFFAVTNRSADPLTSQIQFSTGTGGRFEQLQIEGLLTDEEDTLLQINPIIYGGSENGDVSLYSTDAGDDEVIFHGFVAESIDETLEPSRRFLSDKVEELGL